MWHEITCKRTRCSLGLALAAVATLAYSQSALEANIRKSFLTLSAFECAAIAPNEREEGRLFTMGLKAGREFLVFVEANGSSPELMKAANDRIAILWRMTQGPTPDFILGQIYADRVQEVYKEFDIDQEIWQMRRNRMYRDRNCALL